MLEWLEPEVVLVYGSTPDDVFGEYWKYSEFVRYPDWASYKRHDEEQAQLEESLRKPGRERWHDGQRSRRNLQRNIRLLKRCRFESVP